MEPCLPATWTVPKPSATTRQTIHWCPAAVPLPGSTPWVTDASLLNGDASAEESWVKLPDGSILTYEIQGSKPQTGQRFVPGATVADDSGVAAGTVPDRLDSTGGNQGIAPGKRAGHFAAQWQGALYLRERSYRAVHASPALNTPQGTWVAGPDMLDSNMQLVGCILMCRLRWRLTARSSSGRARRPPAFPDRRRSEEYDPTANTMSIVTTTGPNLTNSPFLDRMLDLPNGQVLVSDSSDQLFVYTPVGTPQAAWRPTVTSITPNLDGTFTLRGTQLNGLKRKARPTATMPRWRRTIRSLSSPMRPAT